MARRRLIYVCICLQLWEKDKFLFGILLQWLLAATMGGSMMAQKFHYTGHCDNKTDNRWVDIDFSDGLIQVDFRLSVDFWLVERFEDKIPHKVQLDRLIRIIELLLIPKAW